MLKFLVKILASKIGKILMEIALSGAGKVLSDLLDTVRDSMELSEKVGVYVKENISMDRDLLKQNIKTLYNYTLTDDIIEKFTEASEFKGTGKFTIAFRLIKQTMEAKGKTYEDSIINFAIEMVFLKMFKS